MISLIVHALAGAAVVTFVVRRNRTLFAGGWPGARPTALEVALYVFGVASVILGWYFNIRYVQDAGSQASWPDFTRSLFTNWAADSAAQDYIIVNLVLFPLWTIVDGRRRGIGAPWAFFVMSLFTSLGFSVAAYLVFVERSVRYERAFPAVSPAASSTA